MEKTVRNTILGCSCLARFREPAGQRQPNKGMTRVNQFNPGFFGDTLHIMERVPKKTRVKLAKVVARERYTGFGTLGTLRAWATLIRYVS